MISTGNTHNNIMLAEHWHLPQALIGESVEVIWPILPPRPTLGPSSLNQLIWGGEKEREGNQGWSTVSGTGKRQTSVPGSSGALEAVDGERGGP